MKINEKRWIDFFIKNNVDLEQAKILTLYAVNIQKKSLPVIFEIEHFSKLLGIELSLASRIATKPERFYRLFNISKKRGGSRAISSPYPKLNYIQLWIKENILEKCPIHDSAFAYRKNRSHIDNARMHCDAIEMLKVDISGFFDNISASYIVKIFEKCGYSKKLSEQLANFCSHSDLLPQGAPTSPIISNIHMYELDKKLSDVSSEHNLIYTRYADDICFSGREISVNLLNIVNKLVNEHGLKLNKNKTRLYKSQHIKSVTGIIISDGKLRTPKKIRREFRLDCHYLLKYGYLQFNGEFGPFNPLLLDEVIGKGRYILSVEPENHFVKCQLSKLITLRNSYLSFNE
ncbi:MULTISPECIES: reverse transcriptase family protein [Vibrio harveyi group]|uniref:reverse transcriptase family protein n=1 Tax=Vibrio harveyi group TaxID=717610 RepID=UPI001B8208ED|nr:MULTISPECIES: reverse transcriptase family protein [Vibrio harveyi group]MDF5078223.1 reverse transcriptase family protein [Vibrio parahaemolyticus]MDF5414826.1 reverse transcriptase family protein [Vibrio parahaemolyticus]MDF5425061.1 reverse transcriptase family protein [Vibrio parahaemolyticus]HBC3864236.1 RNA-directed DNA polymerase [Vibrio parahaemolyticus]